MSGIIMIVAFLPIAYILLTHLLHKFYFAGGIARSRASLIGKTAIVTGANAGIGKQTAMDLARRGARVILACRSEKKTAPVVKEIIAETNNPQVAFMELDLSSFKKVTKFTDEFLKKETRLDLLINNAGVSLFTEGDAPRLSEDGVEMTLMVNHLGHFLLTRNLLDLLIKSGPGSRIVTVADVAHDWANPTAFERLSDLKVDGSSNYVVLERPTTLPRVSDFIWYLFKSFVTCPAGIRYLNSKLANLVFTKELSRRLAGSGVTSYAAHPGGVLTDIGVDRATGVDAYGMDRNGALAAFMDRLPAFVQPFSFPFKDAWEGAQTSIYCAVDERVGEESGLFYADCAPHPVYRRELDGDFPTTFWNWCESVVQEALQS